MITHFIKLIGGDTRWYEHRGVAVYRFNRQRRLPDAITDETLWATCDIINGQPTRWDHARRVFLQPINDTDTFISRRDAIATVDRRLPALV